MTEFCTTVGDDKFMLTFITDNRDAYLLMQEMSRSCVDGRPVDMAAVQSKNADLQRKLDEVNDFEKTQCAKLLATVAEKDKRIARMETDIKLAASGRCCQICSRDCLGHEEITACDAFEYRGAQGVE